MKTEYHESQSRNYQAPNDPPVLVNIPEQCELSKKTEQVELELDYVTTYVDNKKKKAERRDNLIQAFDLLKEDPAASPDFVLYFRGRYVILNHVSERAANRILGMISKLLPDHGFPAPIKRTRDKKPTNGGKRESSPPQAVTDE